MCKSMREHDKQTEIKAAWKTAKSLLKDDSRVIKTVVEQCEVSPEYVREIMNVKYDEVVPSLS